MLLRECLAILREDILHDRTDLVAGDSDKLWSDATLCRYLDEAQRRFARQTGCIRDGTTPDITQLTTVAYQKEYALHWSVLAVISAKFLGNGTYVDGVYTLNSGLPGDTVLQKPDFADLARAGHFQFDCYAVPDRYFFNPNELSTLPPGKPLAFDTDEYTTANKSGSVGVMNFRSYPLPSTDYANCQIYLRVLRLPLNRLTPASFDTELEIPDEYHLDMLDWAAYLALRIVDHELGDPERAAEFKASFEQRVDEARREMLRKMFAPSVWGFGRSGFSYTAN